MDAVSGFDAKEYHAGTLKHFFAPIGVGVSVTNYNKFKTEYERVWRDIFDDKGLEQTKKIYCSRDLKNLYLAEKHSLEGIFIEGIRDQLIETNFFFTLMAESRYIYSQGWHKRLPALEFMKRSVSQYAYICAWKQFQQWRKTSNTFVPLIDEFDGEETLSWKSLSSIKPRIFYRGDMSNPLISTSDIILDFIDTDLRRRKLEDQTVEDELKKLSLPGSKQYIGNSLDLHNITPISTQRINKDRFRARPIYYLLFEEKPSQFDKTSWEETKIYSRMFNFAVKNAFENDGCIKLYDPTSDYKFLTSQDCFIWCGDKGKEIVNAVGKSNRIKDIYYNGQDAL